ncbi:putative DNA-binding domain protein [anaerobic digester metagenome]
MNSKRIDNYDEYGGIIKFMNQSELIGLIDRLRKEPYEREWFEFKSNNYEPHLIGEYLSALSNAACLAGKPKGFLIFGVNDQTHEIIGTNFDPYQKKVKQQNFLLWLGKGFVPNVGYEVKIINHPNGRIVLFEVNSAPGQPVKFYGIAYMRIGSSKTELSKYPEKERAIWTRGTDWSAQICERASINDLEFSAIAKARIEYGKKNPKHAEDCMTWDTFTFLNKAGVTIQGAITNTALLLLGKKESASLLSPHVAKISWVLKDSNNQELGYEHFGTPFILQVDEILDHIRNIKIRVLPSGTLFPESFDQYDPWVIREALHNCIAHQDYGLRGRINLIETPSSLMLTNLGSFIPGDVMTVIKQDAPQEYYRNPFLAEAMVNLHMIDTQGGGIKDMYKKQAKRYFPLPDYDLSDPGRVVVTIQGNILDEKYTLLLMENPTLDLPLIILLDKVQKHLPISKEEHKALKLKGLVEGKYPHIIIASSVAKITHQTAKHIREKGFDNRYYQDLIEKLIREHGPVSRKDIDELILDKLPEGMNLKQKSAKIHNLLSELVKRNRIRNSNIKSKSQWVYVGGTADITKNAYKKT